MRCGASLGCGLAARYAQNAENRNKLIFTSMKTRTSPWRVINPPCLGKALSVSEQTPPVTKNLG